MREYISCLLFSVIGLLIFPLSWFLERVFKMDGIQAAVISGVFAMVVALLGIVVTIIRETINIKRLDEHLGFGKDDASLKKQLDSKLGVQSKSVTEQLGVGEKSITSQLGVQSKSVTEQLGVSEKSITSQLGVGTDDKSLTMQNKEMLTKIDGIVTKMNEETNRRLSMSLNQQEISRNVNALVEQWESGISRCIELEQEVASCHRRIAELEEENERLKAEIHNESNGEDDSSELEP